MDTVVAPNIDSSTETGSFDAPPPEGLRMSPTFCPDAVRDPFDTVNWTTRTATIKGDGGAVF